MGHKRVSCNACGDHGHLITDSCRCDGTTPMEWHITHCVIPCVCDRGALLRANMDALFTVAA